MTLWKHWKRSLWKWWKEGSKNQKLLHRGHRRFRCTFAIVIILVILYIVWHNMYLWCWWHLWNIVLLFTHAWCHGSHAMSIILIFISTTIACLACCQKDLYVCCSFFSEKANVHRWCLHAYQQDMSWATALRFIIILELSTTGEYAVLNEYRYQYSYTAIRSILRYIII